MARQVDRRYYRAPDPGDAELHAIAVLLMAGALVVAVVVGLIWMLT